MNHGKMVVPKQHAPQRKFVVTVSQADYMRLVKDSVRLSILTKYLADENDNYGIFNPIRRILGMETVQKDR